MTKFKFLKSCLVLIMFAMIQTQGWEWVVEFESTFIGL